jgi:hypothetical protein
MPRRKFKPVKFVSFIELTNDTDELLELLAQAESLHVQARTELELRISERKLIKDRLKVLRQDQTELRITDHAIVRYLERVTGVDIEACKQEILSKLPDNLERSDDPVIVTVNNSDNLSFVIRDNLIISVTPTAPNS